MTLSATKLALITILAGNFEKQNNLAKIQILLAILAPAGATHHESFGFKRGSYEGRIILP